MKIAALRVRDVVILTVFMHDGRLQALWLFRQAGVSNIAGLRRLALL